MQQKEGNKNVHSTQRNSQETRRACGITTTKIELLGLEPTRGKGECTKKAGGGERRKGMKLRCTPTHRSREGRGSGEESPRGWNWGGMEEGKIRRRAGSREKRGKRG